jgi:hypothetical protein
VLDDEGKLRKHMAAFIDGRQIDDRDALSDQVAPERLLYRPPRFLTFSPGSYGLRDQADWVKPTQVLPYPAF